MTLGAGLDVLLLVLLAVSALAGLRRGLLLTLVGAAGFVAGAGLGLWLLPDRIGAIVPATPMMLRPMALIAGVVFAALLVQSLMVHLVGGVSRRLGRSPLGAFDALLGAVLTLVVAAATTWFMAGVLRVVAPGELARGIGQSRVIGAISAVMPPGSERVISGVKAALDDYGFPRVFSDLGAEPIRPVQNGDPAVVASPAVQRATASVVRVDAQAPSCSRAQEGTGWVYRRGLVVTNAHVVAGAGGVTVREGDARRNARVVVFDARRDLAVLAVDGLRAAPLELGRDLGHGDSAAIAGYPLAGPLRVDAARVREVLQASGDDIYGASRVERQVYSLLGTVQPGNSGGPLIGTDGRVSGVIFARSLDDAQTGYALTLTETRPVLERADASAPAVSTGACTAAR